MVGIKWTSKPLFVLLIILTVSGCGEVGVIMKSQIDTLKSVLKGSSELCMGDIEWVDFIMINNIKYLQNFGETKEVTVTSNQLGDKVGEVSYMLSEHACTDHVAKNGDAAFLPIGTDIYAMEGYKTEFRVIADNKIYEVSDNPNAATIGDLLDINGRVVKVSLESGMDGSPIGDFTMDASSEFIQELLPLSHVSFNEVYEKTKHENSIFLRVHLQDSTSFRLVYYPKANAFTAGAFGTERLNEIIMTQRKQIKAAAGL
ncbi:hypothetical protein [Paenibacillus macquariensis]|uniref:DUF5643 domain-containing protein n=1 Tax=Paenibacillus macquariensis TaxID=948756 RepID=A0ABY1JU23_9BACL|nr:hypothetical protein [Paenibacillus macquariensis]MEC0091020.1 hypothetical protein [Paenibacillus macquariensis]OAB34738.1 hypothetical protein PMSM_12890 [Paenibacillus macquariensis subsp. macquariensis]SIQ78434.1 hypothetical protein SAMN05421578_10437 [Paenibacillus macquariensis]